MNTISFPYLKPLAAGLTAVLWAGCFAQPGLTSRSDRPPITNAPAVAGPATAAPAPAPAPVAPVVTRRPNPPPANISPAVAEVITLAQSGVDEAVIKSFVANATNQFNPSLDEILYLNDVGISGTLVAALIQQSTRARDARDQREALAKAAAVNAPAAAPAAPKFVAAPPAPPAPAPVPEPAPAPVAAAAPAPAPAAPQTTTVIHHYTYFQDQLAPYGTWIDLPAYGRCWQPSVVIGNPGWRPYGDRGRWHWTDHGWYWQSDYSWGWAPFHYGRWCQEPGYGWVWVPGNVWAPSWVSWRTCDSHIGWAPLPPQAVYRAGFGFTLGVGAAVVTGYEWNLSLGHYTFVAVGRFCDRNPAYYSVPLTQARTIYNQTIINNNYITTNTTVINQGLPADRVAALSRQEVRKVTIRDLPSANTTVRPDRLEREGAEVVIYRPQLQTQSPAKPANLTTSITPTVGGVTATAQKPNVITGRPVYASNGGTPVVTGYTTQPAPAGLTPANAAPPAVSLNPPAQKGAGITPAPRENEPALATPKTGGFTQSAVVRRVAAPPTPAPAPVPTPVPVATGPRTQILPTTSGQTLPAPQPARQEVTKPAVTNTPATFAPAVTTPAFTAPRNQPALQPFFPTPASRTSLPPSAPTVTTPAPTYNSAPAPTRPTFNPQPVAPTPTAPSFGPGRATQSPTPSLTPNPGAPTATPTAANPTGNPKQEQKK